MGVLGLGVVLLWSDIQLCGPSGMPKMILFLLRKPVEVGLLVDRIQFLSWKWFFGRYFGYRRSLYEWRGGAFSLLKPIGRCRCQIWNQHVWRVWVGPYLWVAYVGGPLSRFPPLFGVPSFLALLLEFVRCYFGCVGGVHFVFWGFSLFSWFWCSVGGSMRWALPSRNSFSKC